MEGVIDATTRALLSADGALDWTVTEFIRVVDVRLPPRVFLRHCPELAHPEVTTPNGIPVHVQLLGSGPQALAENALQAQALGATSLDLNFGCPAKTVNRHDGGASLLRDPQRVYRAVRAVHDALAPRDTPVTAKIRLGFEDRRLALACAEAVEAAGASQLVVHARTRREGYRPPAHWEWIGRIRSRLTIPVVANGDIWTLEDYWKARTLSGCRDVMLGRGMLADPWLARRIRHWQLTGERLPATPWSARADTLIDYAARQRPTLPDKIVLALLKQWLGQMRNRNHEAARHFIELKRQTELEAFLSALRRSRPCGMATSAPPCQAVSEPANS
ncbi:tRNA dihydrouridine synthase [Halomonas sp. WWR20]